MKKIAAVFNTKGGCGKTTISLNMCAAAAGCSQKTLYVWAGAGCADAEMYLGLNRRLPLNPVSETDAILIREGFYCCQMDARHAAAFTAGDSFFDLAVFDCQGLPDSYYYEIADRVVIPVELNRLSTEHAKRCVEDYTRCGHPLKNIMIVVNRLQQSFISPSDFDGAFGGAAVCGVLPYEKEAEKAAEKGTLYYAENKKSAFLNGVVKIAGEIISAPAKDHKALTAMFKKQLKPDYACESHEPRKIPAAGERRTDALRSAIKKEAHRLLFDEIDLRKIESEALKNPDKREKIMTEVKEKIKAVLESIKDAPSERHEREALIKEIYDEAAGLGAIEDMLKDESITEIMVNRPDLIYIERKGKIQRAKETFTDNASVLRAIERIVLPLGRRIDESQPYVDARLPDGSRVNAVIPPLAIDGPNITIRKFAKKKLTIKELVENGSVSFEAAEFLKNAVASRKNILIAGGTGSGKTTLLNILSGFIPDDERIITVEDSAELQLTQEHVLRLETRPANIEGKGEVTIRDLVKNALRMRPDRIVVGECRGGEALDMLQAMNTGHEGSMTTVHANSPRDALTRLDVLVLMAGYDLPVKAVREQIRSAIDLIVQQSRLKDGSRKITAIAEVTGMDGDMILMHNIFEMKEGALVSM